jgi:hypothetical protein
MTTAPKTPVAPVLSCNTRSIYRSRDGAPQRFSQVSPGFDKKNSSGDPAMPVLRSMVQSKCVPLRCVEAMM